MKIPLLLIFLVALSACTTQVADSNVQVNENSEPEEPQEESEKPEKTIMEHVQEQNEMIEELENMENSEENWQSFEVLNVKTNENFKISDLEGPLLVKNFAVWCPKCMQQHQEMKNFEGTLISLNIDHNENAAKVKEYMEANGFEWTFAIAPVEMTSALVAKFGAKALSTPKTPVILVCEDGSDRFLPGGFKSVATLNEEIAKGC